MAKPQGPSPVWGALVAIFAGGVAAVSTLANYAEGITLRTFFVLIAGLLGGILAYVTQPLTGVALKNARDAGNILQIVDHARPLVPSFAAASTPRSGCPDCGHSV